MGLPVFTIDRELAVDANPQKGKTRGRPRTAGGTKQTDAGSTPTYLATESLTFTSATIIGTALVTIYEQVAGTESTPRSVFYISLIVGVIMIVLGLIGKTNERPKGTDIVGQIIVGLFNTAILAAAMQGIFFGGDGAP